MFLYLDAKEGLKDAASGAKESVQETGSKLSDKAHGIYQNKPLVFKLKLTNNEYFFLQM